MGKTKYNGALQYRFRSHVGSSMAKRRTCPVSFTSDVVLAALRSNRHEFEEDLNKVKASPSCQLLFQVDVAQSSDRAALAKYKGLMSSLLLSNSSAIFRKLVVREGLSGIL